MEVRAHDTSRTPVALVRTCFVRYYTCVMHESTTYIIVHTFVCVNCDWKVVCCFLKACRISFVFCDICGIARKLRCWFVLGAFWTLTRGCEVGLPYLKDPVGCSCVLLCNTGEYFIYC